MIRLSRIERALFDYLKAHEPRTLGYVAIYKATVGDYYRTEQDAINYVRVLVAAVRKKLGKDAIITVHGIGVYLNSGLELCPCCEQVLPIPT